MEKQLAESFDFFKLKINKKSKESKSDMFVLIFFFFLIFSGAGFLIKYGVDRGNLTNKITENIDKVELKSKTDLVIINNKNKEIVSLLSNDIKKHDNEINKLIDTIDSSIQLKDLTAATKYHSEEIKNKIAQKSLNYIKEAILLQKSQFQQELKKRSTFDIKSMSENKMVKIWQLKIINEYGLLWLKSSFQLQNKDAMEKEIETVYEDERTKIWYEKLSLFDEMFKE